MRPINFPKGTPGRGAGLYQGRNGDGRAGDQRHGPRLHDRARLPVPRRSTTRSRLRLKQGADAIFIDFHAEATSEKQALGYFVDGRATAVVGTHTHSPTADERVLGGGTAYMSDAGMCGDYNSVLGMDTGEPVNRFLDQDPTRAISSRRRALPPFPASRSRSTTRPGVDTRCAVADGRGLDQGRAVVLGGIGAPSQRRNRSLRRDLEEGFGGTSPERLVWHQPLRREPNPSPTGPPPCRRPFSGHWRVLDDRDEQQGTGDEAQGTEHHPHGITPCKVAGVRSHSRPRGWPAVPAVTQRSANRKFFKRRQAKATPSTLDRRACVRAIDGIEPRKLRPSKS